MQNIHPLNTAHRAARIPSRSSWAWAVMAMTVLATTPLVGCSVTGDEGGGLFRSTPPDSVDYYGTYRYEIVAGGSGGAATEVAVVSRPNWMDYEAATFTLHGTPGWDNIGRHWVEISATSGPQEERQRYSVDVLMAKVDCSQDFGDPAASRFVLPFAVGTSSTVTQAYCRTGSGGHHDNYAYDFSLAMGDTIYAARAGVAYRTQASFADGNAISGHENFIYVEHEDGTVLRYVHLMRGGVLVAQGTAVAQGQAIGLNGLTGATSRPHLHLEMFRSRDFSGKPIDILKRMTLPINFRNADGPLDIRNGLVEGATYTALPY